EAAAVGRIQAGEDIEEGGLAGAVGTDQAIDLASLDGDAHIAEGLQAAEAFGNAADAKYCICHACLSRLVTELSVSTRRRRPTPRRSASPAALCHARVSATARVGATASR